MIIGFCPQVGCGAGGGYNPLPAKLNQNYPSFPILKIYYVMLGLLNNNLK